MTLSEQLPIRAGSYVLHLYVSSPQVICIGRRGAAAFPAGHYFYCGSAYGAGGLRARVNRHLRGDGHPHWHIDYLRAIAEVRGVFYAATDRRLECPWSQVLAALPRAILPAPDFGSSDCRLGCAAHLVAFPSRVSLTAVKAALSASTIDPVCTCAAANAAAGLLNFGP